MRFSSVGNVKDKGDHRDRFDDRDRDDGNLQDSFIASLGLSRHELAPFGSAPMESRHRGKRFEFGVRPYFDNTEITERTLESPVKLLLASVSSVLKSFG